MFSFMLDLLFSILKSNIVICKIWLQRNPGLQVTAQKKEVKERRSSISDNDFRSQNSQSLLDNPSKEEDSKERRKSDKPIIVSRKAGLIKRVQVIDSG